MTNSKEHELEQRMRAEFQVGGIDRELPRDQQLEQLASYIYAHYTQPEKNPPWSDQPSDIVAIDTYDAMLPDRITHAAMIMLGAAVDHAMPGVAFPGQITVEDHPTLAAQIFHPSQPNGSWAISLHPGGWWKGSGVALENAWRPEVAAVAELSGTTILDLDYPLVPQANLAEVIESVNQAANWVREQNPSQLFSWGYSSGAALAVLSASLFDALALTFPHLDLSMLPEAIRGEVAFDTTAPLPARLVQYASNDQIASRYPWVESTAHSDAQIVEYISEHRLSTPEQARKRVKDVAEFFNQLAD